MNILVLVEDYPNNKGNVSMMYVHSRNVEYKKLGHSVNVLSFSANKEYYKDDIKVMSKTQVTNQRLNSYDVILSHAPNLKNHVPLLKRVTNKSKIFIFFHGHEIMNVNKHYPNSYDYNKKRLSIKKYMRGIYDVYKLNRWKRMINGLFHKSNFIFVSQWMKDTCMSDLKLKSFEPNSFIINNTIGEQFQSKDNFINHVDKNKTIDVLYIRPYYDKPKYGIDLLTYHAKNNSDLKFHVFGNGEYFKYNKKPDNVILHNRTLTHNEIILKVKRSRLVYLPTRLDAQGVLACEIASINGNLLTSDIPICKEMLGEFPNVQFISNEYRNLDFNKIFSKDRINQSNEKMHCYNKFHKEKTVHKELKLFKMRRDLVNGKE